MFSYVNRYSQLNGADNASCDKKSPKGCKYLPSSERASLLLAMMCVGACTTSVSAATTSYSIASLSPSQYAGIQGDYLDHLGSAMSMCNIGDVNGDNADDMFMGAYGMNQGAMDGAAYMFYGGVTYVTSPQLIGTRGNQFVGPIGSAYHFGATVGCGGDVNGDGIPDVLVGAPNAVSGDGIVYLFYGSRTLTKVNVKTGTSGISGTTGLTITQSGAGLSLGGSSITIGGDVNNDGLMDMFIGVPNYGSGQGAVYVVYGGAALSNIDLGSLSSSQGVLLTGTNYHGIGSSVSGTGDMNGDGYADMLIGAPNNNANGAAYLVYGGASNLASGYVNLDTMTTSQGVAFIGSANQGVGTSVAGTYDVNGDGKNDILIGAPSTSSGGSAYLVYGTTFSGNVALSSLGSGGVTMSMSGGAAADKLGFAVAGAGDYNGDGKMDMMISAPFWSQHPRDVNGAVWVVFGSSSLSSTLDLANLGSTAGMVYIGNQNYTCGTAIAGFGDYNKDGYRDPLVGCEKAAFQNSVAHVYNGLAYAVYGSGGTLVPTLKPTNKPTVKPTSAAPSVFVSYTPTGVPNNIPATTAPSRQPTLKPTTASPSVSFAPTLKPTKKPISISPLCIHCQNRIPTVSPTTGFIASQVQEVVHGSPSETSYFSNTLTGVMIAVVTLLGLILLGIRFCCKKKADTANQSSEVNEVEIVTRNSPLSSAAYAAVPTQECDDSVV